MSPANLIRQFVWTVIPAGRVEEIDGQPMALFSLLLTPRLLGPQGAKLTVADFGMQAWPQRLAVTRFETFRSTTRVTAQPRPLATAGGQQVMFSVAGQQVAWEGGRQAAWEALFPGNLPVRPHQTTSYSGRRVKDFPASEAAAQIHGAYSSYARLLAEDDSNMLQRNVQRRSALQQITEGWRAGLWPDATDAESAARSETSALWKAYSFYRRETDPDFTLLSARDEMADEELDFHDRVARLADHPILLRSLGLLLDFAAPAAELEDDDAAKELHIIPSWPNPDSDPPVGWNNAAQEDLSPRTAYTLANARFLPADTSGTAETAAGLLPLAGAGPVGAGSNSRFEIMPFDVDDAALRMVSSDPSYRDQLPLSGPSAPGMPALRSVGFALVDKSRKAQIEARLERARGRATADGLFETALAADSLMGGYRLDVFDVRTGQWRSLCQRRVRYTIGDVTIGGNGAGEAAVGLLVEGSVRLDSVTTGEGSNDALYLHQIVARWDGWSIVVPRPERIADHVVVQEQPFTVHAEVEPGSLPRLRFGRKYRLRVRLADLAGGGLRPDQVGAAEQQTEEFTYRRFEPIPPPELIPTRAFIDGEGQDKLVVRSDRSVSADDYAITHNYRAYDLRYLFPPKSSLELALQHMSTFDAALGPAASNEEIARFFDTAKRADLDINDIEGAIHIQGGQNAPDYFVLQETFPSLPWLADPWLRLVGAHVRSRPIDPDTGSEGSHTGFEDCSNGCIPQTYNWAGRWPNLVPIALRVTAADSGCTATMTPPSETHRTLTIALGPAEQVTLDIVSCPRYATVTSFGIAHWAGATGEPADQVTDHVYRGKNSMVTPPRTVTVVHAVQRPLRDPSGWLKPKRQVKDTHVVLDTSQFEIHIPSTGRIDIRAAWTDLEDIPPNEPTSKKVEAVVGSYDVKHLPKYLALPEIRHEFGDTRRRRVTYNVTAVSRFRDYFGTITATNPQACTVEGILEVTDVPSAARPPAPTIRYLMPTFRWSRTGEGTSVIRSTRHGGGLRAFLERPWFVSGEDEALAVLAWPHDTPPTPAAQRYLSLAGQDPTWETNSPPLLNQEHFNAAAENKRLEFLREYSSTEKVSAVVHPVTFDKELDCWYADIDLSPLLATSSYFPFVRLGLARYQENTVDDKDRLSPAVLSEPIQIVPDRDLTVRRSGDRATVKVSGLGPGHPRPTTIHAEIQVYEGAAATAGDALIGGTGWTTIGDPKTGVLGSDIHLTIPLSGSRPMRISVTETESYPSAGSSATSASTRVVYADIVPL